MNLLLFFRRKPVRIWIAVLFLCGVAMLMYAGKTAEKDSALTKNGQSYPDETSHTIQQIVRNLTNDTTAVVTLYYEAEREGTVSAFAQNTGENQHIRGIAVFCNGGNDSRLQLALIKALRYTTGIPSSHIYIGSKNANSNVE